MNSKFGYIFGVIATLILSGCYSQPETETPYVWEQSFTFEDSNSQTLLSLNANEVSHVFATSSRASVAHYDFDGTLLDEAELDVNLGVGGQFVESNQQVVWHNEMSIAGFNSDWTLGWDYSVINDAEVITSIYADSAREEVVIALKQSESTELLVLVEGETTQSYSFDGELPDIVTQIANNGDYIFAFAKQEIADDQGSLYIFDSELNLLNQLENQRIDTMVPIPQGIVVGRNQLVSSIGNDGGVRWVDYGYTSDKKLLLKNTSDGVYIARVKPPRTLIGVKGTNTISASAGPEIAKYDFDGNLQWTYLQRKNWFLSSLDFTYQAGLLGVQELNNGAVVFSFKERMDTIAFGNIQRTTNVQHHVISSIGEQVRLVTEEALVVQCGNSCSEPNTIVNAGKTENLGVIVNSENRMVALTQEASDEEDRVTYLTGY
ncbi:MAG: hypothetical protein MI867_01165 [Pseudomonadales bacterium]|nr:hypothetical protein [Pseudomonadales bacterium]